MFKKIISAAMVAGAVAASPASAATVITITGTPTVCNVSTCTFSISGSTTDKNFSGSQTFTLPMSGMLNSIISNIRINSATNIDFTSISIKSPLGVVTPYSLSRFGALDLGALGDTPSTPGTYTLTIAGTSGGRASFGGNLNFTAVPELSTWALMIAGFGVVGFGMRRRNSAAHARRPQLKFI